jgi:uncharacterized damage-inducible protein DinB
MQLRNSGWSERGKPGRGKRGSNMQAIEPEQAVFLLNAVAIPTLKNEHAVTRRVIEAIPIDKGDYRPEPVAKTALELAWHIVAAENRFLGGIAAGAFDFAPFHRPAELQNSADIARWYGEAVAKHLERVGKMSSGDLTKSIDFRGMFQLPAVMYFAFSSNHTIHHRGQLSTYLRPMGGKVPAIYGESYDSAESRKAAR